MVSRGIVEQVVDKYTVKVRIPLLYSAAFSSSNNTIEMCDAKICTLPNFTPNIQVGDVVIVAFEDNLYGKPMVIGYFFTPTPTTSVMDAVLGELTVKLGTHLSSDTTIGAVSPENIATLINARDNLQSQIDTLTEKLRQLTQRVDNMSLDKS